MQPWRVVVATGEAKLAIERQIEARFRAGVRGEPDYRYYPAQWKEPFRSRRFACGMQLYAALGIGHGDKERRLEQWIENYRAFGAPVVLYFFMDSNLEVGSFMDMGIFLQSVMLLAMEEGLGACPQQAFAEYPEIVKKELGIGAGFVLLCGMAMGYEDTASPVNQYRTPRIELGEFVEFLS